MYHNAILYSKLGWPCQSAVRLIQIVVPIYQERQQTMGQYIVIGAVVVVFLGAAWSLWDRFRRDYGIEEWMLKTPGLGGICSDYLDLIKQMKSGRHDRDTLQYLDSQRQVTHEQILGYLGLDRSSPLDVEEFAKRYLNQ